MKTRSFRATGFLLLMINAFAYIASGVYLPFISHYYALKGIDPIEIGILMTIGPLASVFIQPLWAMVSDRTGRRKTVLGLVVLGSGVSMFSYYLGQTFTSFLIATVFVTLFATSVLPLSDAIIIREAGKMNYEFSKIRMGGTIGFAIFVGLAGMILKQKPDSLFFMGSIGYMAMFLFVLKLPKEDYHCEIEKTDEAVSKKPGGGAGGLTGIFKTKKIIFVLAFALLGQIGLSFYWSFMGVSLQDLGYGQNILGWLNCAAAITEIPILIFINRLIKKYGTMRIIFISCIILSLRIFLISLGNLPSIIMSQFLQGGSYMSIYFSCAVYINDNVKPGKQSQGQSTLAIVQMGIGSIIGSIAGGFLVEALGIANAFAVVSAFILSMALLIMGIE